MKCPTLNAPLEEGLAALTGPHPVVVARCVVVTHGAEVHVSLAHRCEADHFLSVLISVPLQLSWVQEWASRREE